METCRDPAIPLVLRLCDKERSPTGCAERKNHADRRPFAWLALRFGGAAMQLRDVFHDRETQARAAELAASRFVGAIKTLENARQIVLANPNALIGDTDAYLIAFRRAQGDRAARPGSISPRYREDCK